ncbi:MAG: hypothetical protein Q9213_008335 [Squamulea squamosa]
MFAASYVSYISVPNIQVIQQQQSTTTEPKPLNTKMSSSFNKAKPTTALTTKANGSSTSKPNNKPGPTSHPSSSTSSHHTSNATTKTDSDGPATAAYKSAQKKIPPREPTPHGSDGASSQACESADVSESERGVMRRERKDVVHQGPGGEFEARSGR